MSRFKLLIVAAVAVVGVGAWYLFRPERAFLDERVSEPSPAETPTVLFAGRFRPEAHKGEGVAQVLELSDGQRVLRFTAFETLNGPDLRVYLLGAPAVRGDSDLEAAGYLDLGPLKGNVGDQNYVMPPGTELQRYRAVSIWCRRFGVNFATAELAPPLPPR